MSKCTCGEKITPFTNLTKENKHHCGGCHKNFSPEEWGKHGEKHNCPAIYYPKNPTGPLPFSPSDPIPIHIPICPLTKGQQCDIANHFPNCDPNCVKAKRKIGICPNCKTPLQLVKDDLYCSKCNEFYWQMIIEYEDDFIRGFIHAEATLYSGIKFRPNIIIDLDEKTFIGNNCSILVPRLTMKKGSQINANTVLAGKDEVILEENVVIGYSSVLLTATDTIEGTLMNDASPENKRKIRRGPIIIKKNAYVGSHSLILPNVTIGEYAVVGAFSYIDKDVPSRLITHPKPNKKESWRKKL